LKELDSGFRRNDENGQFQTFYVIINLDNHVKSRRNDGFEKSSSAPSGVPPGRETFYEAIHLPKKNQPESVSFLLFLVPGVKA
jgi:hypothetical protein